MISHISFDMKILGKRSAGNRHAAFDEAGAGNGKDGEIYMGTKLETTETDKIKPELYRASSRPYLRGEAPIPAANGRRSLSAGNGSPVIFFKPVNENGSSQQPVLNPPAVSNSADDSASSESSDPAEVDQGGKPSPEALDKPVSTDSNDRRDLVELEPVVEESNQRQVENTLPPAQDAPVIEPDEKQGQQLDADIKNGGDENQVVGEKAVTEVKNAEEEKAGLFDGIYSSTFSGGKAEGISEIVPTDPVETKDQQVGVVETDIVLADDSPVITTEINLEPKTNFAAKEDEVDQIKEVQPPVHDDSVIGGSDNDPTFLAINVVELHQGLPVSSSGSEVTEDKQAQPALVIPEPEVKVEPELKSENVAPSPVAESNQDQSDEVVSESVVEMEDKDQNINSNEGQVNPNIKEWGQAEFNSKYWKALTGKGKSSDSYASSLVPISVSVKREQEVASSVNSGLEVQAELQGDAASSIPKATVKEDVVIVVPKSAEPQARVDAVNLVEIKKDQESSLGAIVVNEKDQTKSQEDLSLTIGDSHVAAESDNGVVPVAAPNSDSVVAEDGKEQIQGYDTAASSTVAVLSEGVVSIAQVESEAENIIVLQNKNNEAVISDSSESTVDSQNDDVVVLAKADSEPMSEGVADISGQEILPSSDSGSVVGDEGEESQVTNEATIDNELEKKEHPVESVTDYLMSEATSPAAKLGRYLGGGIRNKGGQALGYIARESTSPSANTGRKVGQALRENVPGAVGHFARESTSPAAGSGREVGKAIRNGVSNLYGRVFGSGEEK